MTPATETLLIKFMADASQYISTVQRVQHVTHNMATNVQGNLQKMSIAFSALGAFKFAGGVINEFSKFDEQMVKSSAVLDTHFLMSEKMKQSALDLSGKAAQSPAELAAAYYDLGQAGKTANQALKALPVFAKFATAGNMNLAKSVGLLTDVQYAMGMAGATAAEDEQKLAHIADVLTKAAVLSKAEVQDFAEALSNTSAGTLKMFNKDLEAGVAILSVYADQGRRGAVAGTSLTRVMLLLSAAAVKHKKAFEKMGLDIFDEQGELRSFSAVVENLEAILGAVPVEERQGILQGLGIKSLSQNALLPLVGTSEAIAEYQKKLKDAKGTMDEIANKTLKSFHNQLKMVWNMFTVLSIEIGERLAPGLAYIKSLAQEMLNWWKSLTEETKRFVSYAIMASLAVAVIGTGMALLGMILPGLLATGSALGAVFMAISGPFLHFLHLSTYWHGILLIRAISFKKIWRGIIALFMFSFSPIVTLLATLLKIVAVVSILVIDVGGISEAWRIVKQSFIDFWEWIKPVRLAIVSLGFAIWDVGVAAFIEMGHHAMDMFHDIMHWLGLTEINWRQVFEDLKESFFVTIVAMEFGIRNFGRVMDYVWLYTQYKFVQFVESFKHFFRVVVPAVSSWFLKNWFVIFQEFVRVGSSAILILAGNFVRMFHKANRMIVADFFGVLGDKHEGAKKTFTQIALGWFLSFNQANIKVLMLIRKFFRYVLTEGVTSWTQLMMRRLMLFRRFLRDMIMGHAKVRRSFVELVTGVKTFDEVWAPIPGKKKPKTEAEQSAEDAKSEFLKELEKQWKPLDLKIDLSRVTDLKIPERELTEWEKKTRKELEEKAKSLGEDFKTFLEKKRAEFGVDIGNPYFFDEDAEGKGPKPPAPPKPDEDQMKAVKDKIEARDAALYFSSEGLSRLLEFAEQAENIRSGRAAEQDKVLQVRDAVVKGSSDAKERENAALEELKKINKGVDNLNKKKSPLDLSGLSVVV